MVEKKFEAVDPIQDMKNQKAARANFMFDAAEIEKNLTEYLDIVDPIRGDNGKVIMVVKRPSMKDMKALVPPEMMKYANLDPEEIPAKVSQELNEKYEDFYYEKMEELIVAPKKTAAEWKDTSNPWLLHKFWSHIEKVSELASGKVESFLEQPKAET